MDFENSSLEEIAAVYRAVNLLDEAAQATERIFGAGKSFKEILEIFRAKTNSATSDEERLFVRFAGNFAQMNALMREGRYRSAFTSLEELAKRDEVFGLLNIELDALGTGYVQLCVDAGRLLSPQQVDEFVLERYAKPSDEARHFLSKQGVAVSFSPPGKDHEVALLFQKLSGNNGLLLPSAVSALPITIEMEEISLSGTVDSLEGYISNRFDVNSVGNFCIIPATHKGLGSYIGDRYALMRIGAYLAELTKIEGKLNYENLP